MILGPFEPSIDTTTGGSRSSLRLANITCGMTWGSSQLPDPTLAHLAEVDQLEERTLWVSASQISQPGFAWDVKTTAPSRLISRLILANVEQLT